MQKKTRCLVDPSPDWSYYERFRVKTCVTFSVCMKQHLIFQTMACQLKIIRTSCFYIKWKIVSNNKIGTSLAEDAHCQVLGHSHEQMYRVLHNPSVLCFFYLFEAG